MTTTTPNPAAFQWHGVWYKPFTPEDPEALNALLYPPTPEPEPVVVAEEPKRPSAIRRAWNWTWDRTKKAARTIGSALGMVAVGGAIIAVAASIATAVTTVAVAVWNWASPPVVGAAVWLWGGVMRVPAVLRFGILLPVRAFWAAVAFGVLLKWGFDAWRNNRRAKKLADVYDHPEKSPKQEPEKEPAKEPAKDTVQGTVVEEPKRVMVNWTKTDSHDKKIHQTMTVRTLDEIGKADYERSEINMRTMLNVRDEQELTDKLLDADKLAELVDHIHVNITQRSDQRIAFLAIADFMKSGDFSKNLISEMHGRLDAQVQFENMDRDEFFKTPVQKMTQTQIQHWAGEKKRNEQMYTWFVQPAFGKGFKEEREYLAAIYADPRDVTAS